MSESTNGASTDAVGHSRRAEQPATGCRHRAVDRRQRQRCTRPAAGCRRRRIVRRDNVVNYEVDKTVRVTRNASGAVKRLNTAVVVNHRVVTDAKGQDHQHAAVRRRS